MIKKERTCCAINTFDAHKKQQKCSFFAIIIKKNLFATCFMNRKQQKQNLLNDLFSPYSNCFACPLGSLGRKNVVFGEGNPDTQLLFIGEAPGQDEDIQKKPFVGRSGKLLTKVFEILGIIRSDVYITNIVKCRPPQNRKPLPLEATTCKQLLLNRQIEIIQPVVICTLGAAALQGLLNDYSLQISKLRGSPISFGNYIIVPTYHPAYILRNPKELTKIVDDISLAHRLSLSEYKSKK